MSAIIGLSDKEIKAIADAAQALRDLHRLTGHEPHGDTFLILDGVMRRISLRWGDRGEVDPGRHLLDALQAIMPPEETEEE